jgi:hypothetical protein
MLPISLLAELLVLEMVLAAAPADTAAITGAERPAISRVRRNGIGAGKRRSLALDGFGEGVPIMAVSGFEGYCTESFIQEKNAATSSDCCGYCEIAVLLIE